jgi:hypothetical protein
MQRAENRLLKEARRGIRRGRPTGPLEDMRKLDQYFREEVQKTVDRQVDPLLDFTYSLGTQAAENVHKTVSRPAPSPDDLPRAPSGTVA